MPMYRNRAAHCGETLLFQKIPGVWGKCIKCNCLSQPCLSIFSRRGVSQEKEKARDGVQRLWERIKMSSSLDTAPKKGLRRSRECGLVDNALDGHEGSFERVSHLHERTLANGDRPGVSLHDHTGIGELRP